MDSSQVFNPPAANPATVIVFTATFPFDHADTYFENEIGYLCQVFDRVVLAPRIRNSKTVRPVPDNCVVLKPNSQIEFLWKGLRALPKLLRLKTSNRKLDFVMLKHSAQAETARVHLAEAADLGLISNDGSGVVAYSLWLTGVVLGAHVFKVSKAPKMSIVSRAHRYDQFPDISRSAACLWQEKLKACDHLYPVSLLGDTVFKSEAASQNKSTLFRHGVRKSERTNPLPVGDPIRVVSCSWLRPIKRVHLIIEAIAAVVSEFGENKIHWTHIGDGESMQELMDQCKKSLPDGSFEFRGKMGNVEIWKLYETTPFHAFVHLSQSEGVPGAVMEAFAHGIPVVATDAGGTAEIMTPDNGVLLPLDEPLLPFISSLREIILDPDGWNVKRAGALSTWDELCNSEKNLPGLVRHIRSQVVV